MGRNRAFLCILAIVITASSWGRASDHSLDVLRLSESFEPESASRRSGVSAASTPEVSFPVVDADELQQFVLERVNRARANPQAEADRLGIGLNDGDMPQPISTDAKQPLAFNPDLNVAALLHSEWMIEVDQFSHTGAGGSQPNDRMIDAGYVFAAPSTYGENLGWGGSSGAVDVPTFLNTICDNLFKSPGHRYTLLFPHFDEIGVGIVTGEFTSSGADWNAVMVTESFGLTAATAGPCVTGVVFEDLDADGLYDVGEAIPGAVVRLGETSVIAAPGGGYRIAVPEEATGLQIVLEHPDGGLVTKTFNVGGLNVKVDFNLAVDAPDPAGPVVVFDGVEPDGQLRFVVRNAVAGPHLIQFSTDFVVWTDLETIVPEGDSFTFTDAGASGNKQRFYRVKR